VLTLRTAYYLAALVFNAFPIPRRQAGTRETLRYMGNLSVTVSQSDLPRGRDLS
jgi:hypothetical protein